MRILMLDSMLIIGANPPAGMEDAIPYSIGLVTVCVGLLLLLWLPDVLRKD